VVWKGSYGEKRETCILRYKWMECCDMIGQYSQLWATGAASLVWGLLQKRTPVPWQATPVPPRLCFGPKLKGVGLWFTASPRLTCKGYAMRLGSGVSPPPTLHRVGIGANGGTLYNMPGIPGGCWQAVRPKTRVSVTVIPQRKYAAATKHFSDESLHHTTGVDCLLLV